MAVVDLFYDRLGSRNWIFHELLPISNVETILDQTATSEEAEQRLIEIYRDEEKLGLWTRRLFSVEGLRERSHQIERALGRNYVIVRQGVAARIRDWYDGQADTFLIDASVYPGNSGGPVIAKPTMFSYVETRSHPKLIGMVSGYVPFQDVARSDQTGELVSVSTENSGLAEVVPIDKVNETIADVLKRHGQD